MAVCEQFEAVGGSRWQCVSSLEQNMAVDGSL